MSEPKKNKSTYRKITNLKEQFELVKVKFMEKGFTFKEVSINTGIPEEILAIYFNDEQNVVSDLSALFAFFKIKMRSHDWVLNIYKIQRIENYIYINRKIHPKASMSYDLAKQEYFNFSFHQKRFKETKEINKELIVAEMDMHVKAFMKRNNY